MRAVYSYRVFLELEHTHLRHVALVCCDNSITHRRKTLTLSLRLLLMKRGREASHPKPHKNNSMSRLLNGKTPSLCPQQLPRRPIRVPALLQYLCDVTHVAAPMAGTPHPTCMFSGGSTPSQRAQNRKSLQITRNLSHMMSKIVYTNSPKTWGLKLDHKSRGQIKPNEKANASDTEWR